MLLASTSAAGGAQIIFLAGAAGDAVGAPGDGEFDFGHQRGRSAGGANQLVELGDDAGDLAAQRVVAAAVHRPALDRALDPQQGALGAVKGLVEGVQAHCSSGLGMLKPLAKPHLRLREAARKVDAARSSDNRHQTIGQPNPHRGRPSGEFMPTQRRLANAIRALAMDAVEAANSGHPGMPMGMADAATALFTRHLKHDPERSPTGPTATASCCRRGMARC